MVNVMFSFVNAEEVEHLSEDDLSFCPVRWKTSQTIRRRAGAARKDGGTGSPTDTAVKDLRSESLALEEVVADLTLENRILKKDMTRAGGHHPPHQFSAVE